MDEGTQNFVAADLHRNSSLDPVAIQALCIQTFCVCVRHEELTYFKANPQKMYFQCSKHKHILKLQMPAIE
jgi:hypothetical protein